VSCVVTFPPVNHPCEILDLRSPLLCRVPPVTGVALEAHSIVSPGAGLPRMLFPPLVLQVSFCRHQPFTNTIFVRVFFFSLLSSVLCLSPSSAHFPVFAGLSFKDCGSRGVAHLPTFEPRSRYPASSFCFCIPPLIHNERRSPLGEQQVLPFPRRRRSSGIFFVGDVGVAPS